MMPAAAGFSRELVEAHYQPGITTHELGRRLGVSNPTALKYMRRYGLFVNRRGTKPGMRFWTNDENRRLRRLWLAGVEVRQIARELNRSRNSIIGQAHRLDLPEHPSLRWRAAA